MMRHLLQIVFLLTVTCLEGLLAQNDSGPPLTNRQRIFPDRTILAVGAKNCSQRDDDDPLMVSSFTMVMFRDSANSNAAFEMAGYLGELYIGGDDVKTLVDSAIVTGYTIDIHPGKTCEGDKLCTADSNWIFQAFQPATHNDSEMIFLDMAGHDKGVMGTLLRKCPCNGTKARPLSRKTTVHYTLYRTRTIGGQDSVQANKGKCVFCEPCQFESN